MELWFTERHSPASGITLRCKRTIYSGRSDIQRIDVIETEEFGRMLLLDGLVMATERDEFVYHEMMVHPAMNLTPASRKRILVVGGGDGGTVRELVKYPCLDNVVLCEIDPLVVEISRRYLPQLSSALADNDRVEIVFRDGQAYVRERKGEFDRIFIDSSDPIGAAEVLFSPGFYKDCYFALNNEGVLVVQSESPIYHLHIMKQVKEGLSRAGFTNIRFYTAPVPTYPGGYWSWAMGFKGIYERPSPDIVLPLEEMEKLGFFTPEVLMSSFVLPAFVKRALG